MGQTPVEIEIETTGGGGCGSQAASSSLKSYRNEIQFLDYLSTDFSYLRRFILASNQMVRLLQTERARTSQEIQEKLVTNIEIAKETLSESGVSSRPFVVCPAHLERHRESYYDMLTAARTLVPYVKDAFVKLRLRRLLLPLTSKFHIADRSNSASPTLRSSSNAMSKVGPLGQRQSPAALSNAPSPRRRTRRSSASAVLKFASSPMSFSNCFSDSSSNSLVGRSTAVPKRPRPSPYPYPTADANSDEPEESDVHDSAAEVTTQTTTSEPILDEPSPLTKEKEDGVQPPKEEKSAVPPLAYVSPLSPKPLTLLQQQHRDLNAGCPAYRKDAESGSNNGASPNAGTTASDTRSWDWPTHSRPSLGGIDCNLPHSKCTSVYTPARPGDIFHTVPPPSAARTMTQEEEDDEASENLNKGLGWFVLSKPRRDWAATGEEPGTLPEGMKWASSWNPDVPAHPNAAELVLSMFPCFPEPIIPMTTPPPSMPTATTTTPIQESTCIVM